MTARFEYLSMRGMDPSSDSTSGLAAPPSRWARAVSGESEALRELAASYWYCVYVWWRRTGLDAAQAATATVASFTRWAGTSPPKMEDSGVHLMRQWLRGRLAELAGAEWEEDGEPVIAVEQEWAEQHYADEPEGDPGTVFDRRWTLTVLEFAMQGLRAEYAARGLENLFAEAAPFVGFQSTDEAHYTPAAERLGLTLGAMKRAIFEFRAQHHDLLHTVVADTVVDPAEVKAELTALLLACDLPSASDGRRAPLPTAIRTFKPEELLARAMNTVQMTSGGAATWTAPSDTEAARLFPQYEMLGLIGRGGMGAVYRARQVALDREVAIKLLPLEVSADPKFAERFVREARAMAKLSHPSIIAVFDFGTTTEGHLFFVMEFVDGANLSEIIRGPGLEPNQALVIAGQVCTALAYAHEKGVIHRDIKPANVMVNTEGMAKVADFGLARLTGPNLAQLGHTVTGTIMGTPEYMSPEQKHGTTVDHRADIFSMGVMLYEMLCREPPQGAFEPPSQRAGCDAGIDQIVLRAMHRTPEGRYQSTVEMKADLDAAWQRQASGTPIPALPQRHVPKRHSTQRHVPLPGTGAGVHRPPYISKREESHGGRTVTLLVAVLVVAAGVYYLNENRRSDLNSVPQNGLTETSAAIPTPIPDPGGDPQKEGSETPDAAPKDNSATDRPQVEELEPLTGPIDLLAGVDVARDAVKGQWQITSEGLRVVAEGPQVNVENGIELLGFNYIAPEEYDFEIEFTIEDGRREVSQVLPHFGKSIAWKMGYANADPTFFSFGDIMDGLLPTAPGRKEAAARHSRLKANMRYRSMVEVRRDSLRALLDGAEVLRWTGDFQRLEIEEVLHLPDPRKLGLAAWGSTVVFHTAVVRPPGILILPPPPEAKPAVPPNVATVPAFSALVAQSKDPHLQQLETNFKSRFDKDVQKPYLTSIATLNETYLTNGLARIRPAARAKGNLDEVTAVDAEKLAIDKGEGVPLVDAPGTPDSLKKLRTAYRTEMKKYTATRTGAAAKFYDRYLVSLDEYVRELTRANQIDLAQNAKTVRDEVAAQRSELIRPAAAEPADFNLARSKSASGISDPNRRVATASSLREAAEWLLANGGTCTISKGTLEGNVQSARELPAGKFEIVGLTLDKRLSKLPPPTDADMQVLRWIKSLQTIWVFCPGLGDEAFEFLSDNTDLTAVHLHTDELTDGVLSHLAVPRKLTSLSLLYSKRFTGRTLRNVRWLPVLTEADFKGCGISDEGLKGLVAARKLSSLSIAGGATTATDAGLASISSYRELTNLTIDKCKGFTDAGLATLARLRSLSNLSAAGTSFGDTAAAAFSGHSEIRQLNLKDTEVTDAGLAKLASLTKLQILNLYGTKVTPAGVDAFKKAVPKCQVLE